MDHPLSSLVPLAKIIPQEKTIDVTKVNDDRQDIMTNLYITFGQFN